jgi:Mg-chelatase subunit ChlD
MAATLIAPAILDADLPLRHLHTHRTNSSLSRSPSMFRSIRDKLSPSKPSNNTSSNNPYRNTSGDAPPAYSPYSPNPSSQAAYLQPSIDQSSYQKQPVPPQAEPTQLYSSRPSVQRNAEPKDDRYAFLASFDTVFLIDDSGSMAGSRWRETKEALQMIAPICTQYDADGIDIVFLNHYKNYSNVTNAHDVERIFSTVSPGGRTPTGQRLDGILRTYLKRIAEKKLENTKPVNIICITDGVASDDVESPIVHAAKKLDKLDAPAWQVGIQFFQVGDDHGAREALESLDDDLTKNAGGDIRDMVDTVPFKRTDGSKLNSEGILKVVLGAVNRKLDRKTNENLHK